MDACAPHGHKAALPVGVPSPVMLAAGNPGVETNFPVEPAFPRTDGLRKSRRIVVGMIVAECVLGMAEQVLAVYEGDGAFRNGFGWHRFQKITPPGPRRGESGGEQVRPIIRNRHKACQEGVVPRAGSRTWYRPAVARSPSSKLAILGGAPVRTRPWPQWPARGPEEERAVVAAFREGDWGRLPASQRARRSLRPGVCSAPRLRPRAVRRERHGLARSGTPGDGRRARRRSDRSRLHL